MTPSSFQISRTRDCPGHYSRSDMVASFPGSPSFHAIIPRMTFDPPERKAEGEPGRFCHMTSVMLRHPYIRYRRGRSHSLQVNKKFQKFERVYRIA